MTFHAKRDRLNPLQQKKRVEGRQNRTHRTLIDATRALDESAGPKLLGIDHAMIGLVRLVEGSETLGLFRPRKATAVDDGATERGTVATEKFCQRMDNDVRAVVERL